MTSTFWPVSDSSPSCIYPDIMVKSSESFKQFYLSRHSGRRLTWQPAMGNADVRVHFREKSHELNVSTHCLVILLLFEDLGETDFLTYQVSQWSPPRIEYYSCIFDFRRLKQLPQFRKWSYSDPCNLWRVQSSRFSRNILQAGTSILPIPSRLISTSPRRCTSSRSAPLSHG